MLSMGVAYIYIYKFIGKKSKTHNPQVLSGDLLIQSTPICFRRCQGRRRSAPEHQGQVDWYGFPPLDANVQFTH